MRYTDFLTETQKKNIKNLSWDWQFKNLDEVLKGFPILK